MSILNPWRELRELKARLASEEAAYYTEENLQQMELAGLRVEIQSLKDQMATMHRRDPKTGRILPRGK